MAKTTIASLKKELKRLQDERREIRKLIAHHPWIQSDCPIGACVYDPACGEFLYWTGEVWVSNSSTYSERKTSKSKTKKKKK